MKNILFIAFIILIGCQSTQKINLATDLKQNVKQYYELINQAELAIIEKKFHQALSYYVKGFEQKNAFQQDYMNAWQVCRQHNVLDSTLILGLLKERKKIRPNKPVSKYIQWMIDNSAPFDTSFMYFFLKMPAFNTVSNSLIDQELQSQIDSIFQLDQKVRTQKKNIKLQDSLNLDFILKKYKNNTLITEATIGKNGMQYLDIMLLHISRYDFKEWIRVIKKEVILGHFSNKKYAQLVDSYVQNNFKEKPSPYLSNFGYALQDKYLIPVLDKKTIKQANKKRKELMLCSIEGQQKRQLWNFRNGFDITFFEFFSYSSAYPDAPQNVINKAIKNQEKFIEKLNSKYDDLLIFEKTANNYNIDFIK